jgi:hypothetical protein
MSVQGERHGRARLSERDVLAMRRMAAEDGLCTKCIAHLFGVSYPTARQAITGRTWRHLEAEAGD